MSKLIGEAIPLNKPEAKLFIKWDSKTGFIDLIDNTGHSTEVGSKFYYEEYIIKAVEKHIQKQGMYNISKFKIVCYN